MKQIQLGRGRYSTAAYQSLGNAGNFTILKCSVNQLCVVSILRTLTWYNLCTQLVHKITAIKNPEMICRNNQFVLFTKVDSLVIIIVFVFVQCKCRLYFR